MRLGILLRHALRALIPAAWRPHGRVAHIVCERTRLTVQKGPFRGLKYLSPVRDFYYPKILGTYELELESVIETALEGPPGTRFIIAGAAEGYYAAGFGLRSPRSEIVAFEADPVRQQKLRELLALNRIDADIRGFCSKRALASALAGTGRDFLLMDIEGGEVEVLDPVEIPDLIRTRILVEIHDFYVAGAGDSIRQRFDDSHSILRIDGVTRTFADLPQIELGHRRVLARWYCQLMNEGRRDPTYWLYLDPHEGWTA